MLEEEQKQSALDLKYAMHRGAGFCSIMECYFKTSLPQLITTVFVGSGDHLDDLHSVSGSFLWLLCWQLATCSAK